ncbi:MAG: hypothetical protein M1829_001474 [Trizodia sp. TS-e1964]|nr:MAG: hypothetical protein M1829_001474 [Trizodia sp. TS-e1964]
MGWFTRYFIALVVKNTTAYTEYANDTTNTDVAATLKLLEPLDIYEWMSNDQWERVVNLIDLPLHSVGYINEPDLDNDSDPAGLPQANTGDEDATDTVGLQLRGASAPGLGSGPSIDKAGSVANTSLQGDSPTFSERPGVTTRSRVKATVAASNNPVNGNRKRQTSPPEGPGPKASKKSFKKGTTSTSQNPATPQHSSSSRTSSRESSLENSEQENPTDEDQADRTQELANHGLGRSPADKRKKPGSTHETEDENEPNDIGMAWRRRSAD